MADKLKSAYELALERLAAKGETQVELSDEQKRRIAEVRSKAQAELAQLEIMHSGGLASAPPDQREGLEQEYATERARIQSREQQQIDKIRAEGS